MGAPATPTALLGVDSTFLAATTTSADGSSRSPTSVAQAARATICDPGRVAPTGLPGLIAKEMLASGQAAMTCTNRRLIEETLGPKRLKLCSARRSGEV